MSESFFSNVQPTWIQNPILTYPNTFASDGSYLYAINTVNNYGNNNVVGYVSKISLANAESEIFLPPQYINNIEVYLVYQSLAIEPSHRFLFYWIQNNSRNNFLYKVSLQPPYESVLWASYSHDVGYMVCDASYVYVLTSQDYNDYDQISRFDIDNSSNVVLNWYTVPSGGGGNSGGIGLNPQDPNPGNILYITIDVSDATLYVSDVNNLVYTLDYSQSTITPHQLILQRPSNPVINGLAIDSTHLYVSYAAYTDYDSRSTVNGQVYSYSLANPDNYNSSPYHASLDNPICVQDSTVYISTIGNQIYAWDLSTNYIFLDASLNVPWDIAAAGQTLFVQNSFYDIYSVDIATRQIQFLFQEILIPSFFDPPFRTCMTTQGNYLYYKGNHLYKIDRFTGDTLVLQIENNQWFCIVSSGSFLYAVDSSYLLYQVDANTGNTLNILPLFDTVHPSQNVGLVIVVPPNVFGNILTILGNTLYLLNFDTIVTVDLATFTLVDSSWFNLDKIGNSIASYGIYLLVLLDDCQTILRIDTQTREKIVFYKETNPNTILWTMVVVGSFLYVSTIQNNGFLRLSLLEPL
jgi:hypothetical protein